MFGNMKYGALIPLLLFLSLQLVQTAKRVNLQLRQRANSDKEDLLNELEELIKKHRSKPMSALDIEKLKLLKEKIGEVSDLMDEIYQHASGNKSDKIPSRMFTDCAEAYKSGHHKSGIYKIQLPLLGSSGGAVFCDMDVEGGGWTVFQRRFNGSVDFYRNWNEYKLGFGNPHGEYWLGLDALHQLTKNGDQEIYIFLEEFNGSTSYARYGSFKVESGQTSYKLRVSSFTGPAGNGLNYQNNMMFSTKDQDNDESSGSCAKERGGGWWYNSCMMSNLNGKYRSSAKATHTYGFSWYNLRHTYQYFLKGSAMMIRPKSFV